MAGVVAITLRLQRNGAVGRLGVDLGVENVAVELPGACDLFYDKYLAVAFAAPWLLPLWERWLPSPRCRSAKKISRHL